MASSGFEVPAGTIVMETAADLQQLDRDLREIDKKGEEAGKSVGESFSTGFGETVSEGGTKDAADELGKSFDQTGEKAEEAAERAESADEKIDELGETMETAGEAGAALGIVMAQKLAGGMTKAGATVVGLVQGGLDLLSGALTNLGEQLQDRSAEFGRFAVAAEGAGRGLEALGKIAATAASAMTGARLAIIAGAGALTIASKRAMDDFVPSWNRVLTLIPEGTEGLTELRREVDELGAELGITAEVTNDTFYQTLSAMPELAEKPTEALDVLRVALEAAATGFTEADTAAKAITGVLNAFQMEASEARRVSDALFAAQDQGVLTFGEIASEISKVSGITNALGGDFEDLLAIVSTTTGELSQSVPETFTQVRGVIRSIVGPTAEAQQAWKSLEGTSGELSAALIRERGLIGALEHIVDVTDGNPEAISRIIPRANAQTLVISLADRMDRLRESLEQVGDASGTTEEKLDQMMDSWDAQSRVFDTQIDQTLRLIGESVALGQSIEDAGTAGLRGLNLLLGGFNNTLEVLNEIDDAIDSVTEDLVFEAIAGTFNLIAQGSEETVAGLRRTLRMMQRVERQSQEMNKRVREAQGEVRLRLPPPGGMTEPGHPLTPRLPPREPDPIERPDAPTGPEFIRARIEARRARMEVEAFQELIETGDVEAYRTELEDIQGVVNDLVEIEVDRLRQMGIEAERLQALIDLYRPLTGEMEDQRSAAEELLQTARDLREVIESQRQAPPLPEGVERMDLGGARARVRQALGPLEEALSRQGDNAREVMEVLDEYGVTLQDLRDAGVAAFADMVEAEIRFEEKAEDGKQSTQELANELSKIASVADGVLQAAEAMGELDDQTRQALRSVVSLVQAGSQIARGNLAAGLTQGLGALGNLVASFTGPSEREQVVQANTLALRRLREDLERLRSVVASTPGDILATLDRFEQAVARFPGFRDESGPFFGQEDSDLFGAPEATGGEVEDFIEEMGLSVSEFLQQAQRFGLEVENITKAMEEGEAPMSGVRQEFEDFTEALREVQFENLFEGVEGAMKRLQDRWELWDVEEPIEKLEMMRKEFLKLTKFRHAVGEAPVEQFDLSTSQGRQAFEQWIQKQWKALEAGTLDESVLGEMTPDEFREWLKRMEGLVDQAGGGGAAETGFQTVNRISRVQASKFIGLLGTNVHWNRRTALAVEQLAGIDSPTGPQAGNIPAPPSPGPGGASSSSFEYNLGPFDIDIDVPPGAGAGEIEEGVRRGVSQGIDEALGAESREKRRDSGQAAVRTF